ncbi:MAG: hypothetical protein HKP03_01410 [Xanthomonadales bacterium]|nr:GAP family protein [Gammaproteobacteria bacterium]MBT8064990.1 GAP family protein [Gammaproteobacteria bacterium]NNJ64400.1 hypothetical protein [Xanthomonadales bacterium]NNK37110.1 hypothetical protein [Xanthomonadales bacterium]
MEIWAVLFPILLTDVMNPVLFAFLVYAAGTERPVTLSTSMLLGHTAAYFSAGLVLASFLESITAYLAEPRLLDFVLEALIGLALLWLAFRLRKSGTDHPEEKEPRLTIASAFGYGAVINFIGIPFAVPYFAAIDQILKADLNTAQAVGLLLAYNLAYALPFATVPVLTAILGARARPLLAKINAFMERISDFLMPLVLGLLGLVLLADAAAYFLRGSSLF